jgi:hypothetical protein
MGCTCQAMRGVVREHFKDIGRIRGTRLQAALTTFPRAHTVEVWSGGWGAETAMRWWSGCPGGGHGRYITSMMPVCGPRDDDFVHAALRGGALPSLTTTCANLGDETRRALLTGGVCEACTSCA